MSDALGLTTPACNGLPGQSGQVESVHLKTLPKIHCDDAKIPDAYLTCPKRVFMYDLHPFQKGSLSQICP